jgi:hypothetical protein
MKISTDNFLPEIPKLGKVKPDWQKTIGIKRALQVYNDFISHND